MSKLHPARNGDHTGIYQYELVDTITGASQVLLDAPIPTDGSEMAWSPDSKSVVVSNVYLPLNVDDPAERALRKAHTFLDKIPSRGFVKISDEDLRLLNWDAKAGVFACDVGRSDSLDGKTTSKAYFRTIGEAWSRSTTREQTGEPSLPDIILDEGMNTPPRIFAVDPPTGRKSLLMDLNPQFQNLNLARVEEIAWKDTRGNGGERRALLAARLCRGQEISANPTNPLVGSGKILDGWSLVVDSVRSPASRSRLAYLDNVGRSTHGHGSVRERY